jgi:hypothetical protein
MAVEVVEFAMPVGSNTIRLKKLDDGQLLLVATDKRQIRPLVREGAPQR